MPLIVDASSIAALALPDEDRSYADSVLDRLTETPGVVPAIFWFELWNVLAINVSKRNRITKEDAADFLFCVEQMKLETAELPANQELLDIAISRKLSAYDAAYLETALRYSCPLATLDEKLRQACFAENVAVFGSNGSLK